MVPLRPLILSKRNCLSSARDCIWLPGDTDRGQEEAQGTAQREERGPWPQGLAVWSGPAEGIYLAGSDAADCPGPGGRDVGKQTEWPGSRRRSSLPHRPGRWQGRDRGGERQKERGTPQADSEAASSHCPKFAFCHFFCFVFCFAHPPRHGRPWTAQEVSLLPLPPFSFPCLPPPWSTKCVLSALLSEQSSLMQSFIQGDSFIPRSERQLPWSVPL